MQRYFVDVIVGDQILIQGSDAHHIRTVLRMSVGDQVICVNDGKSWLCQISGFNDGNVELRAVEQIEATNELPFKVTLIYGLVKNDKFDFVVQKATELGVDKIVPLKMKRSIVKYDDDKAEAKVKRWNAIAKEAAEQSHRSQVPQVTEVIDISRVGDFNAEVKVVAYEDESASSLKGKFKDALKFLKPGMEIVILVGPEGGIDRTEMTVLEAADFVPVSLGSRILRTETAPLFMLSAIVYEHELNN